MIAQSRVVSVMTPALCHGWRFRLSGGQPLSRCIAVHGACGATTKEHEDAKITKAVTLRPVARRTAGPASGCTKTRGDKQHLPHWLLVSTGFVRPTATPARRDRPSTGRQRDTLFVAIFASFAAFAIAGRRLVSAWQWLPPIRGSADLAHHRIVERRSQCPELVVLAGRVDSVGEQHHVQIALPVDPQRCAGEAGVANRGGGQPCAAR